MAGYEFMTCDEFADNNKLGAETIKNDIQSYILISLRLNWNFPQMQNIGLGQTLTN
jgi:hypothetical protein